MSKILAYSKFSDRVRGAKQMFEVFDETDAPDNKPFVVGNEYIFQKEPDLELRADLERSRKIVTVNPKLFSYIIKDQYLRRHTKVLWRYYKISHNIYFLYDIICLYNFAKVSPPELLKAEAYRIFSQVAELSITNEKSQKSVLELLALKATKKGGKIAIKEYDDFLTDLLIYDVVEEVKREIGTDSVKLLFGTVSEKLDKTATSFSMDVGSAIAISASIPEIKRSYHRIVEFKQKEKQWLEQESESL